MKPHVRTIVRRHALGLTPACGLLVSAACAVASLVACSPLTRQGPQSQSPEALSNSLRLDHVQFIGSHNSYKRAMQPELRELIRPFYGNVDSVNYSHLSLTDQLNLGLRNLELDVYNDPVGGTYADPMGNRALKETGVEPWPRDDAAALLTPGFKVMHDADFDFRTCHIALEACLAELRAWSMAHPGHAPIVLTMNTKQGERVVPGAAKPADFDERALRSLDATIAAGVGRERILTPDDVRGPSTTLRESVTTRGWPSLAAAQGRFIFVLDETGKPRERYLAAFPGLRGATLFADVPPDRPEAAIFVINDPVKDESRIRDLVRQGFLVRTRADADTKEARTNNLARFEAAMRSGAQIITTDYYIPDRSISDLYIVRFEGGSLLRANPVTAR